MRSTNYLRLALSAWLVTSVVAMASDDTSARSNFSTFCTPCHAESGTGNGTAGRTLKTRPADFTDCGRMSKEADDKLFRVIKEGAGPRACRLTCNHGEGPSAMRKSAA